MSNTVKTINSMSGQRCEPSRCPDLCRKTQGHAKVFLISCLVVVSCVFAFTDRVSAATYYLDAVNGNDANPGTSSQPWKTLSKALSAETDGDVFYLRDGNYGDFSKTLANHSSWITYQNDTGHSPVLTSIYLNAGYTAYYKFVGLHITPGKDNGGGLYYGVDIRNSSYVWLVNCHVTGTGYASGQSSTMTTSAGIRLYSTGGTTFTDQVTIDSCTIDGNNPNAWGAYGGFGYGISCSGYPSDYVTINNCNISGCWHGINSIYGIGWTVTNNTIHDVDCDAIRMGATSNTTISDNHLYNMLGAQFSEDTVVAAYTVASPARTITVTGSSPFSDYTLDDKYRVRITTASGGLDPNWYSISSNTATTLVLGASSAPSGNMSDIIKLELLHDDHTDGIQGFYGESSESRYIRAENITIARNKIHNSRRQLIFLAYDASGQAWRQEATGIVIQNNLLYDSDQANPGTYTAPSFGIRWCDNTNISNNTILCKCRLYTGAEVDVFANNIILISQIDSDIDSAPTYDGHNLVQEYSYGSFAFSSSNRDLTLAEFKALFMDYDNDDFTLSSGSAAAGFADSSYAPSTDILGNSRGANPDAGCYEYISRGNTAPVLQTIGDKSADENATLTLTVSATDADNDTITYSATGSPTGATFSGQIFSWTPSYSQAGTHQVTFTASDGQAQDFETITITVNNVNRAPVLESIGSKSVSENSTLSFSISAADADGDTITYSVANLPTGAVFVGQSFTWTPGYNQAGTHQVTFTTSDGQAQDSETVTIIVNNVDRPPVLGAIGNKSVYAADLLTFTVDAADPDGDTIEYSAESLPSGAVFVGQGFSWTPSQGQAGSYQVTFTAGDGQLQDLETITVTIYSVDTTAPSVADCSPASGSIQIPLNNLIILHITDAGKGVNADSVVIKVSGNTVYSGDTADYSSAYGHCRRTGSTADYTFTYQSDEMFDYDQTITVAVNAADLSGNAMSEYSYSFRTEMRSFGKNKKVNSNSDVLSEGGPVTVRDSGGNIWAAWHSGQAGSRDVYAGKLTAGAESFGSSVRLTSSTADQCNAAIAIGSDDKLYVAWQDNRRGNWDIYVSTSTDGVSWSAERLVTDSNDNQVNPAIAVDGLSPNCGHIVWQDDRGGNQDIYIARSSDGFVTETVSRITSDSSDQTEPAIAADSDDVIYVAWTDTRGGSNDIYGAASNNGPWTNVAIVSSAGSQSGPAIAAEATGSVLHLLWVDERSGNKDIYYATSNALPSSPLTGSSIIDDTSGADQMSPAIVTTGSTGDGLRVFASWQDRRNIIGSSTDTDLYFAQVNAGDGTNVFVGDDSTNANQNEPAMGIDTYGYPYLVWTDSRNTNADIYYAGSTFIESTVLASKDVSAASGATVGTEPSAISSTADVSVVVPAGAYSCDVKITISRLRNPQKLAMEYLNVPYEFGPSGIDFTEPVTITIPYEVSGAGSSASAYWYDPLTGALSQQGITDVQTIVISPTLRALQFRATHLTQFIVGGIVSGGIAAAGGGGGGGGGCSMSGGSSRGDIAEFLLPYIGLAAVMAVLRLRDKKNKKALVGSGF